MMQSNDGYTRVKTYITDYLRLPRNIINDDFEKRAFMHPKCNYVRIVESADGSPMWIFVYVNICVSHIRDVASRYKLDTGA